MIFGHKISSIFCTPKLVSLDPSNLYLSQWSFDYIFWFVVSKAKCCGILRCWPRVSQAMKHWRIVEIECLAIVGSNWGCQPFSCRCSQNVTHCRKDICGTCSFSGIHSRHSFWEFPASNLYEKLEFPRAAVRSATSALHYGCIMPIASLQLQKTVEKSCLMQRSRGFGHGVMASKICYNAVIVLSVVLCDCCKPMNSCRDWAFSMLLAIVAWKCGCQPFRCPCWQNVRQCRKDFCGTCLFSGIHSHHSFWEFPASDPYKKLEFPRRQYVPPALDYVMVASCPSLRCSCRKR